MDFLSKLLKDDLKTAYETAYKILEMPKRYTEPKIYHGGKKFDLKKRWYVYYSFEHPMEKDQYGNPKMVRQNPIHLQGNKKLKTIESRLEFYTFIQKRLKYHLERGFSPYETNKISLEYTSESVLKYALSVKKKEVKKTTYLDYEKRILNFIDFLKISGLNELSIFQISKQDVIEFLNQFDGAKNRNNYKGALNSIFSILSEEGYVEVNFIKEIRNKKVQRKPVRIFNDKEINRLWKCLREDKELEMFIKFISIMFWRPLENCRIRISDIDFDKRIIRVETKIHQFTIR